MKGIEYSLINKSSGKINVSENGKSLLFKYPCESTVYCTQYKVIIPRCVYRVSLWGAQGGDVHAGNSQTMMKDSGGKGAFVSGKIIVRKKSTFFFYVGGKGEDLTSTAINVFFMILSRKKCSNKIERNIINTISNSEES